VRVNPSQQESITYKWMAISGKFDSNGANLLFHGEQVPWKDNQGQEQIGSSTGVAISNAYFTGGELGARVNFEKVGILNACELIFHWDPARKARLSAGIGPPHMFCVRSWIEDSQEISLEGLKHEIIAFGGDRRNLLPGRDYDLRVTVHGSRVRLFVDGVEVLSPVLPFTPPRTQPGVFCFDQGKITISDFRAAERRGRVFVVMQLSSPYREIYEDVVKEIYQEHYAVRNAEEIYGPGPIMGDVMRDIVESEFVVADITPENPNVYYEVGFADAIGKPVILVANRDHREELPFDIAANRAIYYENTIAGKKKFEEDFRKSIAALEQRRAAPSSMRGIVK
jgi:hypothetical protein